MAIVVKEARQIPNVMKHEVSTPVSIHRPQPAEALDAGFGASDTSEGVRGRHREAAESNEGRIRLMENNFTHGRSRS